MLEFTLQNGQPCAINPRLVSAVFSHNYSKETVTYICFEGNEDSDIVVKDAYIEVLGKIRAANRGPHQ